MTAQANYLELNGIHKRFGKFVALHDIALHVRRGELMVFLGPSGCGKTTLLRIIAGLEFQDRGTIVQDGKDISRLPAIRRDYGIVFQSYALFPNLTIHDNVAYGLVNRRQRRTAIESRVQELLNLVGLPESGVKYPGQLSGGQQQRIAVARALASSPGLLLLDEPLSALDALERVRLRGELRALQQRLSVTTIMVTHDQEEALSIADRIVVMNAGHIEQVGTSRDIYGEPATPFVADFVGRINVLPAIAQGSGVFRVGSVSVAGNDQAVAAGTSVKLYLRPEEIALSTNGAPPGVNALAATISRVEFLGAFCMVGLALDGTGAPPIVANVSRQIVDKSRLAAGQPVTISLPPDALRVLGNA
ncbi:MAG TPA: putative 2-aminoethylphosphonate ABC transporter ATP-binding protein [Casimicrobiaceae bacterium]|nr:putative 2-aminoethylphosphonate ABC transporter ATP-binding protein [Casimicrobiaceae bacterium]